MRYSIIAILFVLSFAVQSFAQVTEKDSIVFEVKGQQLLNNDTYNRYPSLQERLNSNTKLSRQSRSYSNKLDLKQPLSSRSLNMDTKSKKEYEGPQESKFSNLTNPYASDYGYYKSTAISDRSWISSTSTHNTYLTIGSLSKIAASYNYVLNDQITLSAGSYASKYMLNGVMKNDIGVNAGIKYNLNDRVSIHAFGQYSAFSNKNGINNTDRWDMMSTTNYGGAIEYKITDSFGVIGGMSRELNPVTGKWKNVPFITPVFYKNK